MGWPWAWTLLCSSSPHSLGPPCSWVILELGLAPGWCLAVGAMETLSAWPAFWLCLSKPAREGPGHPTGLGPSGLRLAQFIAEQAQGSPGQGQAPWASGELVIPSAPKPHLLSWSPVISINPSCPD